MPLEVGQIAGDYEISSLLGKGGMGRVYRVRNVISNRIEAMKVLLADVAAEADLGDRFIGEIRTLARLDHPNIAKFHSAFKVENQLVMVMEFVEGITLSQQSRKGPIPLEEVLSYVTQTLAALGYAHQNGVIHRDIKPANIMVTPHGVVKLMDFGIAKSNLDPLVTRPGTTMGSMLYMSPEQVRGTAVDARSDIYSVGVMLYELTAGRRPFEAESTFAILDAQLNAAPKPPVEVNPALPAALNDIILTALDKEPARRFQSAEAFRNALESIRSRPAETVFVPAPTKTLPAVTAPAVGKKNHRGLWMAAGAAACVCVLAGAAYMLPHFLKSSAAGKPAAVAAQVQPLSTAAQTPAQVAAKPPAEATPAPSVTRPPEPSSMRQVAKAEARKSAPALPQNSIPNTQTASPVVQPQPSAVAPPAGPSQEELDAASEDLTKMHSRADAVRGSLDHLRAQQAASGLNISPEIAASATRLDSFLAAADHALQAGNLSSARKNMDKAESDLSKLEERFGR